MTGTGTGKTTLLLVLLLVHLLDTQCANLYHGTEYDVLRLYGEYAYPEHRENDWDGNLVESQRQHQTGLRVAYQHHGLSGLTARADVAIARGSLAQAAEYQEEFGNSGYLLFGINTELGWKGDWFGFAIGSSVLLDGDMRWLLLPSTRLEVRLLMKEIWLEGGLLALGAPFDGRFFHVGAQLHLEGIDIHLGIAGVAHVVSNPLSDAQVLELSAWPGSLGGYGFCDIRLEDRLFLSLGIIGAKSPSVRVGIGFEL